MFTPQIFPEPLHQARSVAKERDNRQMDGQTDGQTDGWSHADRLCPLQL